MRYLFGTFELDADGYELRRDARVVHVEPRVLDVLFFLVRHRDRVVSREELLDEVWKTRFIGESALSRCIMQARKAATSAADGEEVIRTVHRRGYRFVAPVVESETSVPDPSDDPAPDPEVAVTTPARTFARFDAQAAKLCARALQLWKKRNPVTMRTAIALLHEAIEIEPDYAPAHAALGDCYLFVGFLQQTPPRSVFPKAEAAIARALEIDPTLAEAHACRGFIETVYGWNLAAADEALDEAIRLDPQLAIGHHRRGLVRLAQRRFADAEASLRTAAAIDPLSPIYATACGLPAMAKGEPAEAVRVYRTVIESEPAFFPAHFYLGLALEANGQVEDAARELRRAVEVAGTETEALPALAHVLGRLGRHDEMRDLIERLETAATQRFISPFFFAVVSMGSNDYDRALEWLNEAVSIRAMRMSDLHLDPRFAPLHDDARFAMLLQRIGTDPGAPGQEQPVRWWKGRRS